MTLSPERSHVGRMHSGETRLVAAIRQATTPLASNTWGTSEAGQLKPASSPSPYARHEAGVYCSLTYGRLLLHEDEIRGVEGRDASRGGPEGTGL